MHTRGVNVPHGDRHNTSVAQGCAIYDHLCAFRSGEVAMFANRKATCRCTPCKL